MRAIAMRAATRVLLLCGLLGSSCATPSIVVPRDDTIFAAAEAHLARDLASVAPPQASSGPVGVPAALSADRALFAQADALYFYRFQLGAPTAWDYLVEGVAAFIEFSPLEALAASEGMGDLRLDGYNGAAQLYETLLDRYPTSPLRPLTLYRLGWAARSVNVEGLPHTSEEAFEELARTEPGTPLARLAGEALAVPYKTQDAAVGWSLLPGAGQMYAGEWWNGAARMTIAAGFTAMAVIPAFLMYQQRRFSYVDTALSLIGIVGIQVTYTASYQDAERAALELNERQEAAFDATHADAP